MKNHLSDLSVSVTVTVNDAVDVIGLHYPSDFIDPDTKKQADYAPCHRLNKPVWSAEESSSYNDLNGASCWARCITASCNASCLAAELRLESASFRSFSAWRRSGAGASVSEQRRAPTSTGAHVTRSLRWGRRRAVGARPSRARLQATCVRARLAEG